MSKFEELSKEELNQTNGGVILEIALGVGLGYLAGWLLKKYVL